MNNIENSEHYSIYWYDADQSVIMLEMRGDWTWDALGTGYKIANDALMLQKQHYPVYSIGKMAENARPFPQGSNAINNLLQIIKNDTSPEELTLFVLQANLLYQMIKTAMQLYRKVNITQKYIFADTVDDALRIINAHKIKINHPLI